MPLITPDLATPIEVIPANQATQVVTTTKIRAEFKTPLKVKKFGSITLSNDLGDNRKIALHDSSQLYVTGSMGEGPDKFGRIFPPSGSITITPSKRLISNSRYYVLFETGAFTDLTGHELPGLATKNAYSFTTSADTTPPQVIHSNINIPIPTGTGLRITFDELIEYHLQFFDLALTDDSGKSLKVDTTIKGSELSFSADYQPNTHYRLSIPANLISDGAGNAIPGEPVTLSFKTGLDTRPPRFTVRHTPTPEAVELLFDKPIKLGTGLITLNSISGYNQRININDPRQTQLSGQSLIIKPQPALGAGGYYISLDRNAVTDLNNNLSSG